MADLAQRLADLEPLITRLEGLKEARAHWEKKILFDVKNMAMMESMCSYVEVRDGRETIITVGDSQRERYCEQFLSNIKYSARNLMLEEVTS